MEIALKLILERAGANIPGIHKLAPLRVAAERACSDASVGDDWSTLIGPHAEYIELMDDVDPDAATYRYPVDRSLAPWSREPYVDLLTLEAAGAAFHKAIVALVAILAAQEPLPTTDDDAQVTAVELAELAACCRALVQVQDDAMHAVRAERERLEATAVTVGKRPRVRELSRHELAPSDALRDNTLALAARAERMVDRIIDGSPGATRPATLAPAALKPIPSFLDVSPAVWREQQQAQLRWFVDALAGRTRALMPAVRAVETRTAGWSAPAARQINLDVARFRSRLMSEAAALPNETDGNGSNIQ
ncbi:MAG TPA: hypothetical protein VGO31_00315 [Microbacteriaceae bacterium]|nr:hypothetical protein [Microbacteriaceae bacterium]